VADVAELAAERLRRPQVRVQQLGHVGHDHRLPANPLLLKQVENLAFIKTAI
jgi:hypothetical protein